MRALWTRWRTDAEFRDNAVLIVAFVLILAPAAAGWLR